MEKEGEKNVTGTSTKVRRCRGINRAAINRGEKGPTITNDGSSRHEDDPLSFFFER